MKPVVAVLASSVYGFGLTWGMLWLIDRVVTVKTAEEMERTLNESLPGEQAYFA